MSISGHTIRRRDAVGTPRRPLAALLRHVAALAFACLGGAAVAGPDCSRPYTLALHEHGLLYSAATDSGIDKDFAAELERRSGCKFNVSVLPRARIWQLIESGALDFSLSGIASEERLRYAGFAWYFSNKYYLLARKDAKVRQLSDVEDSATFRLGVIRSFRYSDAANRLVERLAGANRLNQAGGLDPLYQALRLNRIQGMIMEPFDYPAVGEKALRDISAVIEFNDPAVPHGMIMSNKALSPAEQAKWRALVNDMRADGAVQRIFEKYFDARLAASMLAFQVGP